MKQIPDSFGVRVFDDRVMKAMLPAKIYQSLRHKPAMPSATNGCPRWTRCAYAATKPKR